MFVRTFLYNIKRGVCSLRYIPLPSARVLKVRTLFKCVIGVHSPEVAAGGLVSLYLISSHLRKPISSCCVGIRNHVNRTRSSAGTCTDDDRRESICCNEEHTSPCILPCPFKGYKVLSQWFPRQTFTSIICPNSRHKGVPESYKKSDDSVVTCSPTLEENEEQTGYTSLTRQSTQNDSETAEDEEDWWQGCQNNFWLAFSHGSRQIGRTVYLGSTTIFGNEVDSKLGRVKLIWRILSPAVPGNEAFLNIKDQAQAPAQASAASSIAEHRPSDVTDSEPSHTSSHAQTTLSSSIPISKSSPKPSAISSSISPSNSVPFFGPSFSVHCDEISSQEQSSHCASETSDNEESLDAMMEQFRRMLLEYQAHSESLLGLEAVEVGDLSTAVEHLHTSALMGNSSAAFNLGLCYETGRGVAQDKEKAAYFYKKAASCEHRDACFNLALLYMDHQSEVLGCASECAATLCEDSWRKQQGVAMLQKAASLGLKEAQSYLGVLYFEQSDVDKALPFFQAAAAQNDLDAQYFLAMFHSVGWGLEVSEVKAMELYTRAAQGGHAHAAYSLGVMHELGMGGLSEDEGHARAMYQQAAELGSAEAVARLAHLTNADDLQTLSETIESQQSPQGISAQTSTSAPTSTSAALSPSASSPAFTYHLPQAQQLDPGLLGKISEKIHSFKILFDPGGKGLEKVIFSLGSGENNDNDSGQGSDMMSPTSCDSGSGDEAPFALPAFPFHKSSTISSFDLALK